MTRACSIWLKISQKEVGQEEKSTGTDELSIEVGRSLGDVGIAWMTAELAGTQTNRGPLEWRKSKQMRRCKGNLGTGEAA